MNDLEPLNWFLLEKVAMEAQESDSKRVKRGLLKRGLIFQLSFYGAMITVGVDKPEARRYEFFSDTAYSDHDITVIKKVIREIRPPYSYSIWEWSKKRNAIRVIRHYGPRTY